MVGAATGFWGVNGLLAFETAAVAAACAAELGLLWIGAVLEETPVVTLG